MSTESGMLSNYLILTDCCPPGPWNSPGKNSGVGSHPLVQEIFPMQGSNPGLLYYRQIIYPSETPGKPLIFIILLKMLSTELLGKLYNLLRVVSDKIVSHRRYFL